MAKKKLTIADVRRAAERCGGRVESDGCGGYDLLAPDGRRWIDAEVWCQPIPLNEMEPDEKQDELRRCLDIISLGHEPYTDEPFDPTEVDRILAKIDAELACGE